MADDNNNNYLKVDWNPAGQKREEQEIENSLRFRDENRPQSIGSVCWNPAHTEQHASMVKKVMERIAKEEKQANSSGRGI